jgi:hypothetical protein
MQLPEERGPHTVPPSLRETQESPAFDPDKTQPFMQLPEERGTHTVPPSLREPVEADTAAAPAPDTGPEQGSYSMIDDVPAAGPGEGSIVLVGTSVDVPGPGTVTAQELSELQSIADEFGVSLAIVGSRADGRGRNIDTGLPHGKGPGTRSDIDVLIEGQHDIDSRGKLSESIREMADGVANIASSMGFISPPAIIIRPRVGEPR